VLALSAWKGKTVDDTKLEQLGDAAYRAGYDHGGAVGSFVIDGNTSAETAQRWLSWSEDGDPEMWARYSAPLSGEDADGMTPERLRRFLDVAEDDWNNPDDMVTVCDTVCGRYEEGHAAGWEGRIVYACTKIV
jgi:hypothetical protein